LNKIEIFSNIYEYYNNKQTYLKVHSNNMMGLISDERLLNVLQKDEVPATKEELLIKEFLESMKPDINKIIKIASGSPDKISFCDKSGGTILRKLKNGEYTFKIHGPDSIYFDTPLDNEYIRILLHKPPVKNPEYDYLLFLQFA
jgi:hypothetical protein